MEKLNRTRKLSALLAVAGALSLPAAVWAFPNYFLVQGRYLDTTQTPPDGNANTFEFRLTNGSGIGCGSTGVPGLYWTSGSTNTFTTDGLFSFKLGYKNDGVTPDPLWAGVDFTNSTTTYYVSICVNNVKLDPPEPISGSIFANFSSTAAALTGGASALGSISFIGSGTPAPAAGKGILYFDTTANQFKFSENGGPFNALAPNGGAAGLGASQTWTGLNTYLEPAGAASMVITNGSVAAVPGATALEVNVGTASSGVLIQANDVAGGSLPFIIQDNTQGLPFGAGGGQTLGRLLRMADARSGVAVYDLGLDQNSNFFIMSHAQTTPLFAVNTSSVQVFGGLEVTGASVTVDNGGLVLRNGSTGGVQFADGSIQYTAATPSADAASLITPNVFTASNEFQSPVLFDTSVAIGASGPQSALQVSIPGDIVFNGLRAGQDKLKIGGNGLPAYMRTDPNHSYLAINTGPNGDTNLYLNNDSPANILAALGGGAMQVGPSGSGVPLATLQVSSGAGFAGNLLVVSTGTTPSTVFSVNGLGQVSASGIHFADGTVQTSAATAAGDTASLLTANTFVAANSFMAPVAVGTNPTGNYAVTVESDVVGGASSPLLIINRGGGGGASVGLDFDTYQTPTTTPGAQIVVTDGGNDGTSMTFLTHPNNGNGSAPLNQVMTLISQGVGVAGNLAVGYSLGSLAFSNGLAVSGPVGVGTTSPKGGLDLHDANLVLSSASVANTGIVFPDGTVQTSAASSAADTASLITYNNFVSSNTFGGAVTFDAPIVGGASGFSVAASTANFNIGVGTLTVLSNGNVGIGTSRPGANLQINTFGPSSVAELSLSNNGTGFAFNMTQYQGGASTLMGEFSSADVSMLQSISDSPMILDAFNAQPLVFGTGDTERVRIAANGNVGLGVWQANNPTAALHIIAPTAESNAIGISTAATGPFNFSVSTAGVATAASFVGDGSGLTGVTASSLSPTIASTETFVSSVTFQNGNLSVGSSIFLVSPTNNGEVSVRGGAASRGGQPYAFSVYQSNGSQTAYFTTQAADTNVTIDGGGSGETLRFEVSGTDVATVGVPNSASYLQLSNPSQGGSLNVGPGVAVGTTTFGGAMTVKGGSGDIQEWISSGGVVVASVTAAGVLTGNGSGLTGVSAAIPNTIASSETFNGGVSVSSAIGNGFAALSVTATGANSGYAVQGTASNSMQYGIFGNNSAGTATYGQTSTGNGVYGYAGGSGKAVLGESNGSGYGVYAENDTTGYSLYSLTASGTPLYASTSAVTPGLIVSSTNNVGIQTANPNYRLDVYGDVHSTGVFYGNGSGLTNLNIGASAILNSNSLQAGATFYVSSATVNGQTLLALSGGSVGIGSANPGYKLDVGGQINANGVISTQGIMRLDGTGVLVNVGTVAANGTIVLSTAASGATATPDLFVATNGNIGVNSNSPAYRLDVAGDVHSSGVFYGNGSGLTGIIAAGIPSTIVSTATFLGGIFVSSTPPSAGAVLTIADNGSGATNALSATGNASGGTAVLGITTSGGTAVYGQASGAGATAVWGLNSATSGIALYGRATSGANPLLVSTSTSLTAGVGLLVDPNNRVGLHTVTPAAMLDVNGGAIVRSSITVTADANATTPELVQGFSAGQTAPLTLWQTNPGVTVASVSASGVFYGNGSGLTNVVVTTTSLGNAAILNQNSLQAGTTFYVSSATVDGQTLLALGGGNVGIGTGAPAQHLQVFDNLNASTGIRLTNINGGNSVDVQLELNNGSKQFNVGVGGQGVTSSAVSPNQFFIYDTAAGGSPVFIIDPAADNFGLATVTPKNKLDVNGAVAVGSYAGSNTAPSQGLIVSGNVGIATNNPAYRLDVAGDVHSSGTFYGNGSGLTGVAAANIPATVSQTETFNGGLVLSSASSAGGSGLQATDTGTSATGAAILANGNSNGGYGLYANGVGGFSVYAKNTGANGTGVFGRNTNAANGYGVYGQDDGTGYGVYGFAGSGGTPLWASTSSVVPGLMVNSANNVGIGTASPAGPLDVNGAYFQFQSRVLLSSGSALAVGQSAGPASPSTTQNSTFVGVAAGQGTTGTYDSFFGYRAGNATTTGANNLFMGVSAGLSNLTGNNNVYLGHYAGSTSTNSNNTFVGWQTGGLDTSGSSDTALGYNAGMGAASLTNATAIGANASVSISNAMVLGSGVNVGVSTGAPQARLDVNGGVLVRSSITVTADVNTTTPETIQGSAGGTQSAPLTVWQSSAGVTVASVSASGVFSGNGSGLTGVAAANIPPTVATAETFTSSVTFSSTSFSVGGSVLQINGGKIGIGQTPTYPLGLSTSTGTYGVYFYNNGTGLAAASSATGLYVEGDGPTAGSGIGTGIFAAGVSGAGNTSYGVEASASGSGSTNYGLWSSATGATTNWGLYVNAGDAYFGGKVGIASAAPAYKLDVNGGEIVRDSMTVVAAGTDNYALVVGTGTTPSQYELVVATTGNVGVGASNPGSTLQVGGSFQLGTIFTTNANYNVSPNDSVVISSPSAPANVNLPPEAAGMAGRILYVINASAQTVAIHVANGDSMNGSTNGTFTVGTNVIATVIGGNGGSWFAK